MKLLVSALCVLGLVSGLLGCNGDDSPKTTQALVSGSVSFDGKPIPLDSTVVFTSEAEGATASGMIDSLGGYNLKCAIPSVGIPVGRYKVTVHPPAPAGATGTGAVAMGDNDAYKKMMGAAMKKPKRSDAATGDAQDATKEIPMVFRDKGKSPIVLELKPGENKFEFDLAKLTPPK